MESGGGQRRRTSIYHGQRGSGIQIQLGMQCIITDNESQSQVTMSGGHSHNSVTPPARCCLDGVVTMLVRSRHRHYWVFSKGRNEVGPSKSPIFWTFSDVLDFFDHSIWAIFHSGTFETYD